MKKLFFSFFCLVGMAVFAQNTPITRANYDLAERFSQRRLEQMVFSTTVNPNWLQNSNRFWYEWRTPQGRRFMIVDANTGRSTELFDPVRMAAEITMIVRDPFCPVYLPIENLRFIENETQIRFSIRSSLQKPGTQVNNRVAFGSDRRAGADRKVFWFTYDLRTNVLTHLEDFDPERRFPGWANISPDGQFIVFMRNWNLYWMDRENFDKWRRDSTDETIVENRLTEDGIEHFAWGYRTRGETNVDRRRNENNRFRVAAVWSPDSRHFALVRGDYREVEDLWVINSVAEPRPTLETYRYHMAGEQNAALYSLHLFDMTAKTSREIDTWAFKHQWISVYVRPLPPSSRNNEYNPVVWQGTNDRFFVQRTSRDHRRIDVCEINVATGTLRALIEERSNVSMEPIQFRFVEATGELIHSSTRTGFQHFFLSDANGNLRNAITSGAWHAHSIAGFNPRTRTLFINGMGREQGIHPYYQMLYSVNLNGTNIRRLTPGDYFYASHMNDAATHVVTNFSRVNTVPKAELIDANGRVITLLETADLSRLFEAGYQFPTPFRVVASDGVTYLYGVMYKPFDFDSTKLYPLIVYVYPGPQTEAVYYAFSDHMNRTDKLAQVGFIVVTVGNLGGHSWRGARYHTFGYGNLRDYGLKCKVVAVQQLANRHNFIDGNNVGIFGLSGGGFMSATAILKYPDVFRVAVAHCGNHDNNIYNRWWSEKHHGVLEEVLTREDGTNDTVFHFNMPTNQELAGNLRGRLLLTHGEIDNNVHPAATMRLAYALIRANKRFDMFIIPNLRHSYRVPWIREYIFWMKADYFSAHLLGDRTEKNRIDIRQMNR
ncbi:MAG: DPP IV N-terminal domain-containing protein [Bacteroidales bacterium]|nr:DPP IV N-terminal domain-containing protein [Bacteroidales bacterium]